MNKVMKNVLSYVFVLVLILSGLTVFTACGKDDEPVNTRVMNLSLNPSIELVLNKDNKVVTVNANNHEGNYIIANASFEGLTAEEAVDLFLQVTNDAGFITTSEVTINENKLKISISGENAEELYNSVKSSALDYAKELNVEINVPALIEVTKSELKTLVEECATELTQSEINKMSEEELINTIKHSREETKNFFSEEWKNIYYSMKAELVNIVTLEETYNQLLELVTSNPLLAEMQFDLDNDTIPESGIEDFISNLQTENNNLNDLFEEHLEFQISAYLNTESEYQLALEEYLEYKQYLLKAREDYKNGINVNITEIENELEQIKQDFYGDENGLKSNGQKAVVTTINEQIATAYAEGIETLKTSINQSVSFLANLLDQKAINTKVEEKLNNFYQNFTTNKMGMEESDIQARKDFWNILKTEIAE